FLDRSNDPASVTVRITQAFLTFTRESRSFRLELARFTRDALLATDTSPARRALLLALVSHSEATPNDVDTDVYEAMIQHRAYEPTSSSSLRLGERLRRELDRERNWLAQQGPDRYVRPFTFAV